MQVDKHFRTKSKFYDKVHYSKIEREVEDIYNEFLQNYFKDVQIEHPYACDGLITKDNLKLIMEYKYDYDFNSKVSQAKVITQVLFYLKRFENNGDIIPNIILIGDINECFIMHTNEIVKYLDKDLDWKIAPSGAAEKNPDLVLEISNDETLNPFVFKIDENFQFDSIIEKINDLSENIKRYVHITEHNISNIYDYFCKNVIVDMKKVSANDIVSVFIGCITNDDAFYMHPSKKGILVTPHGNIRVNDRNFNAFFSHYARKYSPVEKNKFAEISDRLIEDTNRRNKGEFYTPTLFVDYAHKMISEALGDDWKDQYVVWDNCCGTKNLTRDYRFKELYCSTLEEAELEIGKKYNPEACAFQYDFLNDDLEKLPKGLLEAFEQNKKIVFFLNPPYGKPSGMTRNGIGDNTVNTNINAEMLEKQYGIGSSMLEMQFIYRIIKITEKYCLSNATIAMFNKTTYLTAPACKQLRNYIFSKYGYVNGCEIDGSIFNNVGGCGISFMIFSTKIQNKNIVCDIIKQNEQQIDIIKQKIVYNTDNSKTLTNYAKFGFSKNKISVPFIKSPLNITNTEKYVPDNFVGWYFSHSNDVFQSQQMIGLLNSFAHVGWAVTPENYENCCCAFSARRLIKCEFYNDKDQFLYPNTEHQNYKLFVNNSIIFSLFNDKSNTASLRNVTCNNKLWDIKNEFFWMSKSEIESLANEYNNDDCYNDAHTSPERFVYKKLQEIELTPEAQAVLNKACDIVRKTFKYRELFNEDHPEYQINNWDCGWYQIKSLAKEYAKDDLEEFKKLYKTLADTMRPMVYELGFLK